MSSVAYGISGGLSTSQIEQMHSTALRVLEEIGIELPNADLRGRIARHAGVKMDGTRVRLAADLVDRFVREHKASQPPAKPPGDEFFAHVLGGYCFYMLDPATGQHRPMDTKECYRQGRLVESMRSRGVVGGAPGLPQDVPPVLREVLAYKISLQTTHSQYWPQFTSRRTAEYIMRMAAAAGHSIGTGVWCRNPLVMDGPTVDMALEFLDNKTPMALSFDGMPIRGVTTPHPLPAAFVESIATNLGAFTMFKIVGTDIGISPLVFPFDMKHATVSYGTPEHVLTWLWANQITSHYNNGQGCWCCHCFDADANLPDAHSMLTRVAFGTAGALAGARHFGFAGWLGKDKIWSPQQLILDVEILDYLRHLVAPVRLDEESLGLEILREVGPGGELITHPSTLDNYRSQWTSPLMDAPPIDEWVNQPHKALLDHAAEMADKALATFDYQLDPAVDKELDRIYRDAQKELV